MKRRDFMKVLGSALGAVTLATSCGKSGGSTAETNVTPIPNGYRFFKVISSGAALPGGNTLSSIPGTVMLNDANEIHFYGMDQYNANGFYELLMDYGGSRPVAQPPRKVVREGDILNDKKEVSRINMGDVNNQGSFAAILQTNDNLPGLYLERQKRGFEPIAGYQTALPGGGGTFGGIFGDVDIHTNDDILLVSHYAPSGSAQGSQGLFYLSGGEVNQKGSVVASTGDSLPDSGGVLTGIGLVDMHDQGNYVMQAYGGLLQAPNPSSGAMDASAPSLLINGKVGSPASKTLKSSSPALTTSKRLAAMLGSFPYGEIKNGPRIGASNNAAFVVNQTADNSQQLYYSGKHVIATGDVSPLGATIVSLSAPVVGSNGLLYYQAVTNAGIELMIYNNVELKTVLSNGDNVDGSLLKNIFFGFMPDQVDSSGRIVLTGDFADGSTSLIIGLPI